MHKKLTNSLSFVLSILLLLSTFTFAQQKPKERKQEIKKNQLYHTPIQLEKLNAPTTAYLDEGFEGTFPPTDWTLNTTGAGFVQTDSRAYSGTYSAYHNDDSGQQDDWLISPAVDLSSATAPLFTYWENENYGTYANIHEVSISTDGGANWTILSDAIATEDTWEKKSFDLTSYVGQTVNIGFFYDGDYADEWYIDDVMIDEAPTNPIASFNYSGGNYGFTEVDSTASFGSAFIVTNTGGGTLSFNSVTGLSGTPFVTDFNSTVTLAGGESDTFAVDFMPTAVGSFAAELIFDSNAGIDTLNFTGKAYDPAGNIESFETSVPPADWTGETISGTHPWEQSTTNAYDGDHSAKFNSFSASVGEEATLTTQRLDLSQAAENWVGFAYAHATSNQGYDDLLKVYFSEDGGASWTMVDSIIFKDFFFHTFMYNVADYVTNPASDNFMVKFDAVSDYGTSIYIDFAILPSIYVTASTVGWNNLQWPPTQTITEGESFNAYSQVWADGVTPGAGQGPGIEMWFGMSTTDTDPATWDESDWTAGTYNDSGPQDNNDEYMITWGSDLAPGTYYYATRYRLDAGTFTYGGTDGGSGGFWDGTTNISGVLTVEVDTTPPPFDFVAHDGIGSVKMDWGFVFPSTPGTFEEGFEGGVIPDTWLNVDNDGDGFSWGVFSGFSHSGNNAVFSFSWNSTAGALTPDNWLITPAIQLGDVSQSPLLNFYTGAFDTSFFAEHFEVLVSTTDTALTSFTNVLIDTTLGSDAAGGFVQMTADLSSYAGQTIYIAWVHNNVTDVNGFAVDDIVVSGIASGTKLSFDFENPAQIKLFKHTNSNVANLLRKNNSETSNAYKIRMEYFTKNHGHTFNAPDAFDHFNIYRNDAVIGTTDTLSFEDNSLPAFFTNYEYYVTAVYDGVESNPSNVDSASAVDPSVVIFTEDFESGEFPPYFTVDNVNNDAYTWEPYNGYSQSGDYSMSVRWNSAEAMDDWVYIGPIVLHPGEDYDFGFGYRTASSTFTENMAVKVLYAVDDSTVGDMQQTLFDSTGMGNTTYSNFASTFTVPGDSLYYIGFHGYSDPDMWRLAVDDIFLFGNGELYQPPNANLVFTDDFENGTGNWQILAGFGLTETESVSPTHSFSESPTGNYPDNANYLATMKQGVDLSAAKDATVSFWAKYDIESGFDYMYLDVTYDGAAGWTTIKSFSDEGVPWTKFDIPLGGYVGHTGVKLRFHFTSDAGLNMQGMYIDDFMINKSDIDEAPPLIAFDAPMDYEGTFDDYMVDATITDISGVQSATLLFDVEGSGTPTIVNPDSTNGDVYYFTIPQHSVGSMIDFAITASDSVGNVDTVGATSGPAQFIFGNYIMYDDNVVTYVDSIAQGAGAAMRMTVAPDNVTSLATALIRNYTDSSRPNGDFITVHVWDDNSGVPGNDLITPFNVVPGANLVNPYEMTVADLRAYSADLDSLSGDYWIGFTVPDAAVWLTVGRLDTELGGDTRSFVFDPGTSAWTMSNREFQFRAIQGELLSTGVNDNSEVIPKQYNLAQNYPNPFNPSTTIKFALPEVSSVKLVVYNVLGKEITTLINKDVTAGTHQVQWNASLIPSGVYFVRIVAQSTQSNRAFTKVQKMMLLK